jgi:hypothetical protein
MVVANDYNLEKPEDMIVYASYSTELGDKKAFSYAKDALRVHRDGAIIYRSGTKYYAV